MLLKAFEKVEELQKDDRLKVKDFKLMTADAHSLPFKDDEFDSAVATFMLESAYDVEQVLREMKRVVKNEGNLIIISRGQSYISLYNEWLKFKAARDLSQFGTVEHLDIEKIIEDSEKHPEFKVFYKERKNMGMTYLYVIDVLKTPPPREEESVPTL